MPFTTRDGVRLHWEEQGSGTPVLLCMGASYSGSMWYPAVPSLAENHRVIWWDNRGTGQSEATAVASIQDMASDALAVLEAAGESSAHVYGVSLGGVVVQQIAVQAPDKVRSLVVGCSGILSPDKPRAPKWLTWLALHLPKSVVAKLTGRGGGYGSACTPERAAKDLEALAKEDPSKVAIKQQQDALRAYSVTKEQIAALTVPALVLHGTEDKLVPYAWGVELSETLPGARLVTFEGAAHNYLVAVGEPANTAVLEFLAEVDASVSA
jgi:pimeloyl-ACP methyl ester carboxylesterase